MCNGTTLVKVPITCHFRASPKTRAIYIQINLTPELRVQTKLDIIGVCEWVSVFTSVFDYLCNYSVGSRGIEAFSTNCDLWRLIIHKTRHNRWSMARVDYKQSVKYWYTRIQRIFNTASSQSRGKEQGHRLPASLCVAREAHSLDARTPRSAVASFQLPSKSVGLWLHFSLFDIEWDICNRVLEFEFPWSPSSRPLPTPPTPTS